MKKLWMMAAVLLAIFVLGSCDDDCVCDDEEFYLQVITPDANQVFSQDFTIQANKVVIEVVFNQPVNPATVVAGETVLMESGGDPVEITTTLNAAHTVLTIRTVPVVGAFCTFSPDCGFSISLLGTDAGEGVIRDANGNALDGDADGIPGGVYVTGFGIIG